MERYIRSFSLTEEICKKIDSLPNRSAWLRELLQTILIDKSACVINRDEVVRLIDQRLSMIHVPNTPTTTTTGEFVDVDQELEALLQIAIPAVAGDAQ